MHSEPTRNWTALAPFDLEGLRARLRAANPTPPTFDHLRDPDLLQRLIRRGNTIPVENSIPTEDPSEPVKRRQRRPTLASVIRQMQRAGVSITGAEIDPRDGTVKLVAGKPSSVAVSAANDADDEPIDRSEWH